ncbi:hypothetical protein N481_25970 [Pseudoalteromonas luteoviolacea S4047-1]|nr:hypothetical protein N481_25970 [Pseudoalteromonas luteoviolacea S4047-1]
MQVNIFRAFVYVVLKLLYKFIIDRILQLTQDGILD